MNFHDKVEVLNLAWNILRQNSETEVRIPDAALPDPILCLEEEVA